MLKFAETAVTFSEIPDEITLVINITQCPNKCKGCHSPHLQKDIGELLAADTLKSLIRKNVGISCVCLMGGDSEPNEISRLFEIVKENFPNLKTAWYSGRESIEDIDLSQFDFIKLGPYVEEFGPLNSKTTNQKLFEVSCNNSIPFLKDITYKFWRND